MENTHLYKISKSEIASLRRSGCNMFDILRYIFFNFNNLNLRVDLRVATATHNFNMFKWVKMTPIYLI